MFPNNKFNSMNPRHVHILHKNLQFWKISYAYQYFTEPPCGEYHFKESSSFAVNIINLLLFEKKMLCLLMNCRRDAV